VLDPALLRPGRFDRRVVFRFLMFVDVKKFSACTPAKFLWPMTLISPSWDAATPGFSGAEAFQHGE